MLIIYFTIIEIKSNNNSIIHIIRFDLLSSYTANFFSLITSLKYYVKSFISLNPLYNPKII